MSKGELKIYYNSLNGLRAISAIGIVLMHIQANSSYEVSGFLYNGVIPQLTKIVFLFMAISAFGICCGYYERFQSAQITPSEFYEKRYRKILPFFALVCVVDFIMSPSLATLIELLADFTLVFGLLPNASISVIGVGWFLGTVFVFYMLFPFICFCMKTKRRCWVAFGIAVFYNITCTLYFFDGSHMLENTGGRSNFIYSAMFFMAGCLIYLYRVQIKQIVRKFAGGGGY